MLDIISIVVVIIVITIIDYCDNLICESIRFWEMRRRVKSLTEEVKPHLGPERLIEITRDKRESRQVLKDSYKSFVVQR